MTRDEILAMARQAGIFIRGYFDEIGLTPSELEHFAALVAAAEREECAKVCEEYSWAADIDWWIGATKKDVSVKSALECAAAIRARFLEE